MAAFQQIIVGQGSGGGGGGGYTPVNTEAADLFAREAAVGVARDDTSKEAADDFIGALKAAGVWSKIECLHIGKKAPSALASVLDWTRNRTGEMKGAMAWAASTGWSSTGSDANFLEFNDPTSPNVAGLASNNQWMGVGVASHGTGNQGGHFAVGPNMMLQWTASTTVKLGLGSPTAASGVGVGASSGRFYASRAAAASGTLNWSVDGGSRTGISNSTGSWTSRNIVCGRNGAGIYGSGTWEWFAHGEFLTLAEEQAFDAAIAAYLA